MADLHGANKLGAHPITTYPKWGPILQAFFTPFSLGWIGRLAPSHDEDAIVASMKVGRLGFPSPTNVTILVVTVTVRGDNPRDSHVFCCLF